MTRVLVPIAVLESEAVSLGLMNLLSTMDVTVLGYHVLPEQTPPDQARAQYEDRATDALEDITEEFRQAGGDANHRLVFTHDRKQSIDRVADDVDASAYAITGATGTVDRILVPLTGDVDVERIVTFVTDLVGDRDIDVTLFAATQDANADAVRSALEDVAADLDERGPAVDVEFAASQHPFEALVDAIPGHDAIVMGERAPSLQSLVFGEEARRVAAESVGPVLVVRREPEATADDASDVERDAEGDGRETDGAGGDGADTDGADTDGSDTDTADDAGPDLASTGDGSGTTGATEEGSENER
ncbi:universal stress protein [Halorubellus sp. PRR65]|uniref:universal stress protein n=1 Tax=Halorubellus sp. PRR65 TaxID=3098148 RepID=UPI002B25E356|nr:universal stress protein [Halorubellus sp. PRR65]